MSSIGKKITSILSLTLLNLAAVSAAESSIPQSPDGPPDFLFVIDISNTAKNYKQDQIFELKSQISTGLDGAMIDGETYTIWAAGKTIDKKSFPMVTWSRSQADILAAKAIQFLSKKDWNSEADWGASLRHFYSAIKGAKDINLIIISSPTHFVWGTPFDSKVKKYIEQKGKKHLVLRKPLVTAIKCQDTEIIDLSLSSNNEVIPLFKSLSLVNESKIGSPPERHNLVINPDQSNSLSKGQSYAIPSKPIIMVGDKVLNEEQVNSSPQIDSINEIQDPGHSVADNETVAKDEESIEFTKAVMKPKNSSNGLANSSNQDSGNKEVSEIAQESSSLIHNNAVPGEQILEVQAKEVKDNSTRPAPPMAAANPNQKITFTLGNLYMTLGVASIITSLALFILALKFKAAGNTSLITDAYNLNKNNKSK